MFKKRSFYISLLCIFLISGCLNDSSKNQSLHKIEIEDTKVTDNNKQTISELDVEQITSEEDKLQGEINPKPAKVKAVIKEAEEVAKENIAKSENKGKSCDEIIKELESLINEIIEDKSNKELMGQLAKWNTDVLHNNCRKNAEYEAAFLKIISSLN